MILWTRRALGVAGALALLALTGYWLPWGVSAMVVADVAFSVLILLDGWLAVPAGPSGVSVTREPPAALTLGRSGEVI